MSARHLLALASLALLATSPACDAPEAPAAEGTVPVAPEILGAALADAPGAVIAFGGDWTIDAGDEPLIAGGTVRIVYDPSRLPRCRGRKYGMETWSLVANWRASADAPAQYLVLTKGADGLHRADVPLDATSGTVELWFSNGDAYGCHDWDSAFGANYLFPVQQAAGRAALRFAAGGGQALEGRAVPRGLVELHYDLSRLAACAREDGGMRLWTATAHWRFLPGGQSAEVPLFPVYSMNDVPTHVPVIQVPTDASALEVWFKGDDGQGCVTWDSQSGANYRFGVAPLVQDLAIGWTGGHDFVTFTRSAFHYGDVPVAWYFDDWQGQPRNGWIEVRVWAPGLTDRAYGDAEALRAAAGLLRAEAVTEAIPGELSDGWGAWPLTFERQQGNDFVYAFRFSVLRWGLGRPALADGLYGYRLRFSADDGASWVEDDHDRAFVVAPRLDCSLFPVGARPPECPAVYAIGWAGGWNAWRGHDCHEVAGLDDPARFEKSGAGHDCMAIGARVWVPGLTDADLPAERVRAEVVTDLGFGEALAEPQSWPLTFAGRVGNDYRFRWDLAQRVSMSPRGDYRFKLRFSVDDGATWTEVGTGDGPGGTWRTLAVRNDSMDR